ncbi:DUF2188 domain-containing protein [Pseudoalteromonas sp. SG45-5]|uniref:DUF2188 domain-containing protein n=1 Tax=unclassified Pseudoalteromonas TaxID=194690 RepID=UPI0015FA2CBF|nr:MULTISPECIES: DUF2188 domain-containing protein [unclassified Pseudoalteromonas]MBB1387080.1 DUF2188 domain-containing protein [Pseudoalteromonas sp. SG45-5]MBB1395162.1 DUF2188 domain-containing protein [Pseudoalteromonas sp. SG44-4]MBB1447813.1 DUF2188 domain-containing protein [Pseudoalteromonas sp. SG41-6]
MSKNQWVTKRGEFWAVIGEGNVKVSSLHTTQKSAIVVAKRIAKNQQSELIVQNNNNKIRLKNSYGRDVFPPKG